MPWSLSSLLSWEGRKVGCLWRSSGVPLFEDLDHRKRVSRRVKGKERKQCLSGARMCTRSPSSAEATDGREGKRWWCWMW